MTHDKWTPETVRRAIEITTADVETMFRKTGAMIPHALVFGTRNPNDGTPLDNMFAVAMEIPVAGSAGEGEKKDSEIDRVREWATKVEAVAVVVVCEAWMCVDDGSGTRPVDSPNRKRILWIGARSLWGAWDWFADAREDGTLSPWTLGEGDEPGRFDDLMPAQSVTTMVGLAREALSKVRWAVSQHVEEARKRFGPEAIMFEGKAAGWGFLVGVMSPGERPTGAGNHHATRTVMPLPPELAAEAFRLAEVGVNEEER